MSSACAWAKRKCCEGRSLTYGCSSGYRWFSGPTTEGKLFVKRLDGVCVGCTMETMSKVMPLRFTENGGACCLVFATSQ
jgi:hypothetical protein